jgi:hypothetical protein
MANIKHTLWTFDKEALQKRIDKNKKEIERLKKLNKRHERRIIFIKKQIR